MYIYCAHSNSFRNTQKFVFPQYISLDFLRNLCNHFLFCLIVTIAVINLHSNLLVDVALHFVWRMRRVVCPVFLSFALSFSRFCRLNHPIIFPLKGVNCKRLHSTAKIRPDSINSSPYKGRHTLAIRKGRSCSL